MDAELLKQLTRIADALEAQNTILEKSNTINEGWVNANKQWRDEDIHTQQREAKLAQREREYQRMTTLTEGFLESHPGIFQDLIKYQLKALGAQVDTIDGGQAL